MFTLKWATTSFYWQKRHIYASHFFEMFQVFYVVGLTGGSAAPEDGCWPDLVQLQPADSAPHKSARAARKNGEVDVKASSAPPGAATAGCLAGRPPLLTAPAGKLTSHTHTDTHAPESQRISQMNKDNTTRATIFSHYKITCSCCALCGFGKCKGWHRFWAFNCILISLFYISFSY